MNSIPDRVCVQSAPSPALRWLRAVLACGVVAGSLVSAPVYAGGAAGAARTISVSGAWIRAVPAVSRNSAGYLLIENAGPADELLGAAIAGARVTEIHEMVRSGESMLMRRRVSVPVPENGRVALAPGGLHLMLIGLQAPLKVGETRAAVLRFRDAGEVNVEMVVVSE
jgi:copper(I)-binding protein